VKGELRLHEIIFLAILVILDVYLLNLNIVTNDYQIAKKNKSTANYMDIEEIIKNNSNPEVSILNHYEEKAEEIEVEPIVYDGMTIDELAEKLNKSLNSTISGKGYLIASHSLEMGVDPYMATAIILHETGCKWECSYLVNACNNVGGQKGSGCGAYSYFESLDSGITAFIDNLERNYISYGLTTPESINPKYAEDPNWSSNVNKYIEIIKAQ
jgi:hypothetical protein